MELTREDFVKFKMFMKEHVKIRIYNATNYTGIGGDNSAEIGVSLYVDDEEISKSSEYLDLIG